MRKFILRYLIPRIIQFLTIIFVGITVTFVIPRLSPTDPVEAQISMMMARGETLDPQSIASMRAALTDLYGLSGGPVQQYFAFWSRLLRGDLGPSLANFPTPVSEMIGQAMPYTLSLLVTAVIISWIFGNLFLQLVEKEKWQKKWRHFSRQDATRESGVCSFTREWVK